MKEKELRLALICYGGVSLAVYMHGITKEVWRLARASRARHDTSPPDHGTESVWLDLLIQIEAASGTRVRILPDILAGASAGGINAIFLAHAVETGQSLEPLTRLWLEKADADILLDPDARPWSRFAKFWAIPFAWLLLRRQRTVEGTVARETRAEVRAKLSRFVRARWFSPPFGGAGFCRLLLDAFDAMADAPAGPPLLPEGQPLDLFVTATDFPGHAERLSIHSPAMAQETEHRLAIGFSARGSRPRRFADVAELVFAARATASFPGAFPPFTVRELDAVMTTQGRAWPGRAAFLARILPAHWSAGVAEDVPLIDGSVLANAPFGEAIAALRNRPARREVDRRFVYIEPTPGGNVFGRSAASPGPAPGFFRTILGAISTIPREQPIHDDLDRIAARSRRIRDMQGVIEALRPSIDATIDTEIGSPLFIDRPTPARLGGWRQKAHRKAAASAGFAFAAYSQLKLAGIVGQLAALFADLSGPDADSARLAERLWDHVRSIGADRLPVESRSRDDPAIAFLRDHDLAFRVRRLRFLARRLAEREEAVEADDSAAESACNDLRTLIYEAIGDYAARETRDFYARPMMDAAKAAERQPGAALSLLADARGLKALDTAVETRLADALAALPTADRRRMLRWYLGFPFYDIATLPMLQGEGLDEYDPIKVDRIAPDDAQALRRGNASATLKGIEFNSFGAFFSRAYRENDYLWGRLHGADRLADILLSTVSGGARPLPDAPAIKRRLFAAILDEEAARLPHIAALIAQLRDELRGA